MGDDHGPDIQQEKETTFSCVQYSVRGDVWPCSSTDNRNKLDSMHEIDADQTISTEDLLSWSFQIARGMDYLFSKKVMSYCFRETEQPKLRTFSYSSGSSRRLGRSKCFVGGQRSR